MKYSIKMALYGMMYIPSFMEIDPSVQGMLRFCLSNLNDCNVGIIDLVLWITPFKWVQMPWYTYQVFGSAIQKLIEGYTYRQTDSKIISWAYFNFFKIRKVNQRGKVVPMLWRRMGSGGIALPFLTSALDWDKWSASRPGRFTAKERTSGTHWIGVYVVPEPVWTLLSK
jgi:hypothetical protein